MNKILIAHRGNIFGPNYDKENSPAYLWEAMEKEYNVELDVWLVDDIFYLGHNGPEYRINETFLEDKAVWAHAKNIDALVKMLKNDKINCFWHQADDVVLTSKGYLWTYPGKYIASEKAIAVIPELAENWNIEKAVGICSDYIGNYEKSDNTTR